MCFYENLVSLHVLEDFGGHGNSFHGSGGRGNKRGQMRHCLRLLRSVVSTADESVLQDLSDQGVVNQIISKSFVEMSEIDQFIHKSSVSHS